MQVDILNIKGEKTGRSVELPDEIFGIEPNDHVIYLAVKQFLAAQRQGTHKVKTRLEVKGSSKKLHRQKGTKSCIARKVPAAPVKGISATPCIRAADPSSVPNPGHTISS